MKKTGYHLYGIKTDFFVRIRYIPFAISSDASGHNTVLYFTISFINFRKLCRCIHVWQVTQHQFFYCDRDVSKIEN